jgi:hypothetical protein
MCAKVRFAHMHMARAGARGLLAWDAGRLVNLAGWGFVAGLLAEEEAWTYILPMAQAAQRSYASWEELGKHYLLGREFWSGEWEGAVARAHLAMLDRADSPWRQLPWGLDLNAHGIAAPLQAVTIGTPAPPPPPPAPAPVKKSNAGLFIGLGAGALLLLVAGGVGIAYAMGAFGGGKQEVAAATSASAAPAAPAAPAPPPSATHEPSAHPAGHPGAPAHAAGSAHAPPAAASGAKKSH